jgi:hypothetical protein
MAVAKKASQKKEEQKPRRFFWSGSDIIGGIDDAVEGTGGCPRCCGGGERTDDGV